MSGKKTLVLSVSFFLVGMWALSPYFPGKCLWFQLPGEKIFCSTVGPDDWSAYFGVKGEGGRVVGRGVKFLVLTTAQAEIQNLEPLGPGMGPRDTCSLRASTQVRWVGQAYDNSKSLVSVLSVPAPNSCPVGALVVPKNSTGLIGIDSGLMVLLSGSALETEQTDLPRIKIIIRGADSPKEKDPGL